MGVSKTDRPNSWPLKIILIAEMVTNLAGFRISCLDKFPEFTTILPVVSNGGGVHWVHYSSSTHPTEEICPSVFEGFIYP